MDELTQLLLQRAQENAPTLPINEGPRRNLSLTPLYDQVLANSQGPIHPLKHEDEKNYGIEKDMKLESLLRKMLQGPFLPNPEPAKFTSKYTEI